jgi:hypothetical protein
MKITKAKLKQIIVEELEAVMKEEEDEEQVEEAYAGARPGPSHRDRPGYQAATVRGRVASRSGNLLQKASAAVNMSPTDFMMALAQEMDVDLAGQDDPALPAAGEPAFPEGV